MTGAIFGGFSGCNGTSHSAVGTYTYVSSDCTSITFPESMDVTTFVRSLNTGGRRTAIFTGTNSNNETQLFNDDVTNNIFEICADSTPWDGDPSTCTFGCTGSVEDNSPAVLTCTGDQKETCSVTFQKD